MRAALLGDAHDRRPPGGAHELRRPAHRDHAGAAIAVRGAAGHARMAGRRGQDPPRHPGSRPDTARHARGRLLRRRALAHATTRSPAASGCRRRPSATTCPRCFSNSRCPTAPPPHAPETRDLDRRDDTLGPGRPSNLQREHPDPTALGGSHTDSGLHRAGRLESTPGTAAARGEQRKQRDGGQCANGHTSAVTDTASAAPGRNPDGRRARARRSRHCQGPARPRRRCRAVASSSSGRLSWGCGGAGSVSQVLATAPVPRDASGSTHVPGTGARATCSCRSGR